MLLSLLNVFKHSVCSTIARNPVRHNLTRAFSITIRAMAPVKIGDKLPQADLFEDSPANKITIADLSSNKKILIFGVPGAFTPGCSKTHLPGYIEEAANLKSKHGLSEIVCISVNDPFVMSAWGKAHSAGGKVRMLADPAANFIKSMDMTIDLPPLGGVRSKRFSMIVDNGKITELHVELDGTGLSCSLANNIGQK